MMMMLMSVLYVNEREANITESILLTSYHTQKLKIIFEYSWERFSGMQIFFSSKKYFDN